MGSRNSVSKRTKSFHCKIKEVFGVRLPSSKLSSKYYAYTHRQKQFQSQSENLLLTDAVVNVEAQGCLRCRK